MSMKARCATCGACGSSATAISSASSPTTNGRRSRRCGGSRRAGRAGTGCPSRASSGSMCASKIANEEVTSTVDDVATALGNGAKRLKATYDFAIHTHGSIGPSCAIVDIKDGKLTCWTPSQATHNLRKQLAAMLGMTPDNVRAIYIDGSGCYGRNGHEDAAADAALLARATGKPVRVQWMREDEHGWDPKGPPTLIDLEGALDGNGDIIAWSSQFFIPEGGSGNVPLVAAELAALPHETAYAPGNIQRNTDIQYVLPNVRTVAHRLEQTPFRPSWIRTPGRM